MHSGVILCHYRMQTECAHYRTIADEAYRLLTDMRDRNILSQSQAGQLCDWLELVDEVCFHGFFLCTICSTFLIFYWCLHFHLRLVTVFTSQHTITDAEVKLSLVLLDLLYTMEHLAKNSTALLLKPAGSGERYCRRAEWTTFLGMKNSLIG